MSDKPWNQGQKEQYPWEIGTRLAAEVRARDFEFAAKSILMLVDIIKEQSNNHGLDEARLRVLQAISIANRATYDAGANPELLFNLNLNFITNLLNADNWDQISSLSKSMVLEFISLVPERDLLNDKKLNIALAFIREHCMENLSRKTVAEVIKCSPASLNRLFSKELGRSFKEVVLKQRIDRAKELLCDSNKTVNDVAFDIGYSDPNYFIAAFRRITGITPGQYRRKITQGQLTPDSQNSIKSI